MKAPRSDCIHSNFHKFIGKFRTIWYVKYKKHTLTYKNYCTNDQRMWYALFTGQNFQKEKTDKEQYHHHCSVQHSKMRIQAQRTLIESKAWVSGISEYIHPLSIDCPRRPCMKLTFHPNGFKSCFCMFTTLSECQCMRRLYFTYQIVLNLTMNLWKLPCIQLQ